MTTLDETTEIEELAETAKAEKDAFEVARREVKSWDQKSAVHYYRLGHALTLAKIKLGRGLGKPGGFQGWHVRMEIDQNLASRAMRLYEAALDDGGEEALAGILNATISSEGSGRRDFDTQHPGKPGMNLFLEPQPYR